MEYGFEKFVSDNSAKKSSEVPRSIDILIVVCLPIHLFPLCLCRLCKMSTAVKRIREGLFQISWVYNPHQNHNILYTQVPINDIRDIFESSKSSKLTFKMDSKETILKLDISFITNGKPEKIENLRVLASKDGAQRQMKIVEETQWKASWKGPLPAKCHHCSNWPYSKREGIVFEILIELDPYHSVDFLNRRTRKPAVHHLVQLLDSPTESDVVFKCEDKTFKAHTLILKSGSPVMAAMFQHDFKENKEGIVEIIDIKPKVFEALLQYIYAGDAILDEVDVADLLVAADKYGVDSLKDECESHLTRHLSIDNVTSLLILGHLHKCRSLEDAATDFMATNARAVCSRPEFKKLMVDYPDLCFVTVRFIVDP